MTQTRKRTTAEVWHALEKVTDEVELARIDALSDADLDAALREAGIEPAEAARIGKDLSVQAPSRALRHDGATARPVAARSKGRASWVAWLAAAAIAAIVVAAFTNSPENVGHPVTPSMVKEGASKTRADAYEACREGRWASCQQKLDEARELDPAGETDPRVQQARRSVYEGQHAGQGNPPR